MYCIINIQNPAYDRKFRHIRVLLSIFSHIVAYLEPCVNIAHSEPCHSQTPDIS